MRHVTIFSDRLFVPTHVAISHILFALSSMWNLKIYAREAIDSEIYPSLKPVLLTNDEDIWRAANESDLFHCYAGSGATLITETVQKVSKSRNIHFTISIDGTWLYQLVCRGPKSDKIEEFINSAHRIIVPTNSQMKIMTSIGIPSSRIDVVRPGLPLEQYKSASPLFLRHEFRVCFVGRLTQRKNVMAAFKAFQLLHSSYPDSKFIVVGDGPEKNRLLHAIKESGLENHCVVLGLLSHDKMLRVLVDSSVLCCPAVVDERSTTSGLPFVVIESQAMGIPVVAVQTGGMAEGVVDGITGFLTLTSDPQALAEILLKLASDRNLLRAMSTTARSWVRENFDIRLSIQSLHRIFQSTIETPANNPRA
jgi:glycosyltransferase involved in cell wall biosynthesis